MRQAGEWKRGWPVVAAAMIGIGSGPGLFQNLSSLFVPGMAAEFGWSRGAIATAAGVGLLGALLVPLLGRLSDRLAARKVIVGAMLLLGGAYVFAALQTGGLWQYQVLTFLLALTIPGTSTLVYGRLIADRFVRHRGLAIGVAVSGLSVTTMLVPPILAVIIASHGWRSGYVALAILVCVIALPLCLLAIRKHGSPSAHDTAHAPERDDRSGGMTAAAARRSASFWRMTAAGLLVSLATIGLVTQLIPFGLDHGLSSGGAALLLAAYGGSQVVGRLAIGALVDHLPPRLVAAGIALISAVGFALLQVDGIGLAPLMTAVFLAGLMSGADNDLLPFFTARFFGLRAFGEIYGTTLAASVVGTAIGIVGFGRLYDATGGYALALGIATGALVTAAVLFTTLRDPVPPS